MAVHIEPSTRPDWEAEGERIAPDLTKCSAVLVIGSDPHAAARVALAIAKQQARRRRVALVDAVGELAPIEKLLPADVAHGLVDMLYHGVSPGRVAIPVDRAGNLFVVPSGAAPLHHEELFASDGWSRLAATSREAGALLLVLVPDDCADVLRIAETFEGAVIVGDALSPAGIPALGRARVTEAATERESLPRTAARASAAPRAPFLVAIAATVLAVGVLAWWAVQSSTDGAPATSSVTSAGVVVGGSPEQPARSEGGAADSSIQGAGAAAAAEAPGSGTVAADAPLEDAAPLAVEPDAAVPFAVALAQYDDVTAALARVAQESARGIPASTYTLFYDTNLRKQVYLVMAGAFHDRDDATSLLRSLRRQRVLAPGQGHVIDAPFAILMRSGLPADEARAPLDEYRLKGLPVYSLVQSDGRVNIYAGAFRTAADAGKLRGELDSTGASLHVVQRAGRPAQ